MNRPLAALLLVASSLTIASAQTRPDFTGRWTTEPEAGAAPAAAASGAGRGRSGDMGSGWGPTITIAQVLNRLTVEYAFFTRGDMQPPLKFAYSLDGSETKNAVMMGRGLQQQSSKTAWDGDVFVITTTHTFVDPSTGKPAPVEVVQRLTLASPASLIVETTRKGVLGGPDITTKTSYRKLAQ
jgi:hypothetical protein